METVHENEKLKDYEKKNQTHIKGKEDQYKWNVLNTPAT